ncbi:MAG: amidase family protein, partial [Myxococcota bacterium]
AFLALDPSVGWPGPPPDLSPIPLEDVRFTMPQKPFWLDCSPGVAEVTKAAIDELIDAGAKYRPVDLPNLETLQALFEKGALTAVQLFHFLQASLPDALDRLDDNVRRRLTDAGALPAAEYLNRRDAMAKAAAEANAALADGTILVSPTVAITPPRLDELEAPGVYKTKNLLMLRNTSMPSLLGLCALSIPVGLDKEGMPVGLQLAARGSDELRLLRVGLAVEARLGPDRLPRRPRPTP